MVVANRYIVIGNKTWKHLVQSWLHTISLDDEYSIKWVSGHSHESILFVGGENQQTGAQMERVAHVHKELGRELPEEFPCKFSRFFVMWPFHKEEMDDDDDRQLNDLPPEDEEVFSIFSKFLQQDEEDPA